MVLVALAAVVVSQSLIDRVNDAEPPASYSRVGVAGFLGVGVRPSGPTEPTVHGRIGVHWLLFERTASGEGPNVGVALLIGGGTGRFSSLGLDARVGLLYLGSKLAAAQPIGQVFLSTGLVVGATRGAPVDLHAGVGLGFDVLFSGLLPAPRGWLGVPLKAIALVVTSPALELRATWRSDGSTFGTVLVGIGI